MRAFAGQQSDSQPIKRNQAQKQAQLAQLKEQLAALKSHAAPALREGIVKRIADLERDLGAGKAGGGSPTAAIGVPAGRHR